MGLPEGQIGGFFDPNKSGKEHINLPQDQAGGGLASEKSGKEHVYELSPTFIKYLKHELESPQQESRQEGSVRSLEHLMKYICSPDADIEGPVQDQSLSWPISNYFISSSHNTYLTGNQLYSDASADGYKNVGMPDDLTLLFKRQIFKVHR